MQQFYAPNLLISLALLCACVAAPVATAVPAIVPLPSATATIAVVGKPTPTGLQSVPLQRLAKLKRGVNIARWFMNPSGATDEYFSGYLGEADFIQFNAMGITSVRLVLDPALFLQAYAPATVNVRMLTILNAALDKFQASNILVVIDMQDNNKDDWEQDPKYVSQFFTFWSAMAQQLSVRDPGGLILEVLNEPVFAGKPQAWQNLQEKLVQVIRAAAPLHTIVVTGDDWGGVDGLLRLPVLPDKNLIYSFHFYEPYWFSHQGAGWSDKVVAGIKALPYPSSPELCVSSLKQISEPSSKKQATAYCDEHWNAARVEARLSQVTDWRDKNGVPIWMGEFGIIQFAPAPDRERWFTDIAAISKKFDLPMAMWGYDDGFGMARARDVDGNLKFDPMPAKAMGWLGS